MSYLTWREYVRTGPVCLGVLLVIVGAILALMSQMGYDLITGYTLYVGAGLSVLGLLLVLCGFFFTKKKRDSVLKKVDTRQDDVPPPPPRD
ncbi:MAG: LPXTG cell wall anchor domain-containing protein [Candidatus Thorarchaeota archaeon]